MSNLYVTPSIATDAGSTGPSPVIWEDCPIEEIMSYPGRGFGVYDDFMTGLAADVDETTLAGYIATVIGTSGGDLDYADQVGSGLVMRCAAADNKGIQLQGPEAFKAAAGSTIWFETRLKITDADQADLFVGLSTTDADIAQSNANDTIGIILADGAADLKYKVAKDGTGSATDTTADMSDATYTRLGFKVNGTDSVEIYVDGVLKKTVTSNICDDEELAVSIAIVNGASSAQALTVDWVRCYQTR